MLVSNEIYLNSNRKKNYLNSIDIRSEFSKQIKISPLQVSSYDGSQKIVHLEALIDNREEGIHPAEFLISCGTKMKTIKQYLIDRTEDAFVNYPNFIQPITDSESGNLERICYDIGGKIGKYIEIYREIESFTSIKGQFSDNHLFSKITIDSPFFSMLIDQNKISYNDKVIFYWDDSKTVQNFKNNICNIQLDGNLIEISSSRKEIFNNKHFIINRNFHSNDEFFLEFGVKKLENYRNIEGLLGKIGNNKFSFYNSIHSARKINARGVITVNGHFMTTMKVQKDKLSCWLIDVRNFLHPMSISNLTYDDVKLL